MIPIIPNSLCRVLFFHLFLACVICYCSFLFVVSAWFVMFFLCSRWSFVYVPLIFFCPADHVPDWRVLCAGFLVSYRAAFLVRFEDRFSNISLTGTYTPSAPCPVVGLVEHSTKSAGRALLLPGNRLCHIEPFRWKLKRKKKGTLIKCRGALTCAWNILKRFVRSWLGRRRTTHMQRPR